MTSEPNPNDFIERIVEILSNSTELFPRTVGNSATEDDLVKQVIAHNLAIAQDVVTGEGPPHIFVMESRSFIMHTEQIGRESPDRKGARIHTVELYAVCIVNEPEFSMSQKHLNDITVAVQNTLGKNQRLLDKNEENPLSISLSTIVTPYTELSAMEKNTMGKTVVIRPKVTASL